MKLLLVVLASLGEIFAQSGPLPDHWVSTWAASPQKPRMPTSARPQPPIDSLHKQTVRMIAHITIPGQRVRIELSNAFGGTPLVIGAAHIALRDKESAIVPASDRTLLFGGRPGCWIPPGATLVSDAVNLSVPAAPTAMPGAATTLSYYWLANIDVAAPPDAAAAIVTFGDSITDGFLSTPDTDRSWPSFLARRLAANRGANIAVLNQGISGNRLLRDGAGVNALARFDRDVLAQPGVKWLMHAYAL